MNRREIIRSGLRDIVRLLPTVVTATGAFGGLAKRINDFDQLEAIERPKCFPSAKPVPEHGALLEQAPKEESQ